MQDRTSRALFIATVLSVSTSAVANSSRTESLTYHDNKQRWIVGQQATLACVSSIPADSACDGDIVSATNFDATTAMPVSNYSFGRLVQTLEYDAISAVTSGQKGTVKAIVDGNGNRTETTDWYRGIPRSIRYAPTPEAPAGAVTILGVDTNGWIQSVRNEVGSLTCYGYDLMGRVNEIIQTAEDQLGVCNDMTWAKTHIEFRPMTASDWKPPGVAAGQWRQYTHTGNHQKLVYFDALWRPVLTHEYDAADTTGTLRASSTQYDAGGRAVFQSYPSADLIPAAVGTWTTYDAIDRVTRIRQDSELGPLDTTTAYQNGFQTLTTNPRGYQTRQIYQTFDQPTYDYPAGVDHPEGASTEIYRNIHGKITALRRRNADASVQIWRRYVYNDFQQVCKTVEPEVGTTVIGYDAGGNQAWSAAGLYGGTYELTSTCSVNEAYSSGRVAHRTYDGRNRLRELLFPDGKGNQLWTYAADNRPAQVTTWNIDGQNDWPVVSDYVYNKRRLLIGESIHRPNWYVWGVGYGYDALGNLAAQTYPTGLAISYAPNALGQATQARDQSGTYYASAAAYYPNGMLKQFNYGNGIAHSMIQNTRQLPASTTDSGATSYGYAYDAVGNTRMISDGVQGIDYLRYMYYDGLDRLTRATSISFGPNGEHTYSYDVLNNLKSSRLIGVRDYASYVYDARNRLVNVKDAAGATVIGLDYDDQGNLLQKNGQAYAFDFGNRLRSVAGKEGYHYDAHGRRVLAWDPTSQQSILSQYTSNGQMLYQENYRSSVASENIYFAGSIIATRDRSFSSTVPTIKYQHTDALGSPVAVTDTNGFVIERNNYEPYGAIQGKPAFQGVGYTGHMQDGATGLTYMQQRYYDSTIGRFLSVDPVTAFEKPLTNFNRYAYALNSPYQFVDPDGRDVILYIRDGGGRATNFGHAAVRVRGNGYDVTFDFGRYRNSWGFLNSKGEGVLRVWKDSKAFEASQSGKGDLLQKEYKTTPEFDLAAINHFVDQIKAEGSQTIEMTEQRTTHVLSEEYELQTNNCTTQSLGAIIAGEAATGHQISELQPLRNEIDPRKIHEALEKAK